MLFRAFRFGSSTIRFRFGSAWLDAACFGSTRPISVWFGSVRFVFGSARLGPLSSLRLDSGRVGLARFGVAWLIFGSVCFDPMDFVCFDSVYTQFESTRLVLVWFNLVDLALLVSTCVEQASVGFARVDSVGFRLDSSRLGLVRFVSLSSDWFGSIPFALVRLSRFGSARIVSGRRGSARLGSARLG